MTTFCLKKDVHGHEWKNNETRFVDKASLTVSKSKFVDRR